MGFYLPCKQVSYSTSVTDAGRRHEIPGSEGKDCIISSDSGSRVSAFSGVGSSAEEDQRADALTVAYIAGEELWAPGPKSFTVGSDMPFLFCAARLPSALGGGTLSVFKSCSLGRAFRTVVKKATRDACIPYQSAWVES